jgi:hypothetical protein
LSSSLCAGNRPNRFHSFARCFGPSAFHLGSSIN